MSLLHQFKSRIKRVIKGVCKKAPYLNVIFVAEQLIRSISEVIYDAGIEQHVIDIHPIRPTSIEHYRYTSEMAPAFRTEMYFPKRHVYRLKNVTVNTQMGACCTASHGFLESHGSLRSWILSRPMVIGQSSNKLEIDAPVICVNSTGFAHFLVEELPRLLWVLRFYPDARLVTPLTLPGYIEDYYGYLGAAGILKTPPIRCRHKLLNIPEFVFTQAESYSGFWHSDDVNILREVFLKAPKCGGRNRIYVSRRNSPRSFDNELQTEELLKRHGFEIVYLEKLHFSEQIEVFQASEFIVAPHGAGLANLVWCSPGTRVVEIFSPEVFNDCFARLSSQLSCDHYCLWARTTDAYGEIDLNALQALVDKGGKTMTVTLC